MVAVSWFGPVWLCSPKAFDHVIDVLKLLVVTICGTALLRFASGVTVLETPFTVLELTLPRMSRARPDYMGYLALTVSEIA